MKDKSYFVLLDYIKNIFNINQTYRLLVLDSNIYRLSETVDTKIKIVTEYINSSKYLNENSINDVTKKRYYNSISIGYPNSDLKNKPFQNKRCF